ncbi:mannan endo-1,4-beta-mannosidase, partial [Lecanoromycetidae sp. Uapishka_2]
MRSLIHKDVNNNSQDFDNYVEVFVELIIKHSHYGLTPNIHYSVRIPNSHRSIGEWRTIRYGVRADVPDSIKGTNTWWLSQLQNDTDVANVFSELALSQIKVTRVWGFSETNNPATRSAQVYFQVLNSTGQYFNFDPNTGIPILDYIISTAEAKGVKIVLPLLNNWSDLGGIPAYNTAFNSNATSFYTDPASQAAYKAWITLIVNRYKISPAIFAWELANEPRCSGCSSSVITNWASSISAYIKSLDPKHMVALGDEGWFDNTAGIGDGSYAYTGYEGVNWVANLAISTLDYGTFHSYPDQWGYNDSWVNTWITQHDSIGQGQGKPVVLEEYGSTVSGNKSVVVAPWQETVLANTSVAYDSFWQFATTLSIDPFDDYAIEYSTVAGSDYEILGYQHAAQMLAKSPVATM